MPFTFAHPAIVLPLSRVKYFSLSALVIGSLAPDFVYFITMKLTGRYSHTMEGIFTLDLPLCFVAVFIFHQIIKRPLIDNLPDYFNSRLQSILRVDLRAMKMMDWLIFFFSALVGILTHLLWDSFTHREAILVNTSPGLIQNVKWLFMPEKPLYVYLQHISTLLGTAAIVWFFHRLPRLKSKVFNASLAFKYWTWVFIFTIITFVTRILIYVEYYGDVIATLIGAFFLGLILTGLIWKSISKPDSVV